MKIFQPNIDGVGRLMRAFGGLCCAVAGALLWPTSHLAAIVLGVAAAFMFFEAARGWCAARACGIKTPL